MADTVLKPHTCETIHTHVKISGNYGVLLAGGGGVGCEVRDEADCTRTITRYTSYEFITDGTAEHAASDATMTGPEEH